MQYDKLIFLITIYYRTHYMLIRTKIKINNVLSMGKNSVCSQTWCEYIDMKHKRDVFKHMIDIYIHRRKRHYLLLTYLQKNIRCARCCLAFLPPGGCRNCVILQKMKFSTPSSPLYWFLTNRWKNVEFQKGSWNFVYCP